ncbi:cadherin-related tumor suppressor-like [Mercenaria mercenaria]|uniref:cadherin-related tumor suppressor-like n=1 Tax=Mercenaria mercenaria TaxID=6596 RepID=UPI00234EF69F|nr:cadherin-related tumor suppressor-like [Mercenaria mercenaria]
MENMQKECGIRKKGPSISRKIYLPCVVLLLQFFFKFAQGQGPGDFQVYENREPGTEVGTIQMDLPYTYTFNEGTDAKDYFNLDANTGRITTKVIIDRESLNLQENKFSFLILGHSTDGSNSNIPIEVTIEVLDENDNGPVFPTESATVHFRENAKMGTQGYITTATDADDGRNSLVNRYDIISGIGPFKLVFNPDMYGDVLIIETTGDLDREKKSSYSLTIQAMDSGSPQRSGTTLINIIIDDENDNAPVFDPSERFAQVNETDQIGTFVIQLTALDLDIGVNQEITYKIAEENDGSSQFRIDNSTGQIFTAVQPLSCPKGQCILIIEAKDNGKPPFPARAFVYITVIDTNNHNPVIKFKYVPSGNEFSSINEDANDGMIVAGVSVTDADDGANPTAKIISGNELRHFRFEQFTSGLYFVKVNGDSVLDRERHHIYNLTVEASDNGNPPRMSINYLIIYVNDINDHAPIFKNKKVKLSISETTKVGTFIESMLATDLDSGINAKLAYKIVSGNSPEWFHIDKDTGLVTTQSKLHYEQHNYFRMNISVHDGAQQPLKDFAELEISIWDENDMAPEFSQTVFNASLEENLARVSPVVFASAIDNDSGLNGTIVYEFHPHVDLMYPKTFHIDSNTGEVTTKKILDREEIPNYIIEIIAKDRGQPPLSSTATVYLKVLDVNDNSPVFYPKTYYASVIEGQGRDTEVVAVTATDLDEGEHGEISYSFSSSNFGKFAIDSRTGMIRTTDVLQKNLRSSYLLSVVANDKTGLRSDAANVQVSVQSPTDSQPYFTSNSYKFNMIPEDHGNASPTYIGAQVGRVTAKADSSVSGITYSIVDGDPTNVFTLETTTGWIKRSQAIDREMFPVFTLEIVATVGEKFAKTEVIITVKDTNDNAPVFEFPYRDIDIIENWAVGHYIALISATDADEEGPNSDISYSLQRNQNNMFAIQSDTGLLFLNKPVKYLGADHVTLLVLAMDAGNPPFTANQELRLKVKDVNNHTPKFAHTTYEMSLIESHPVNSRFFHVIAVDKDLGENGELTYNITRGNEDKRFGIFPDGHLYIAKELDRETKDLYKLSVVAHDHGIQQRSSECNITVHISDFNDNKPIFLNATYSFYILENKNIGSFVGHVKASDDDMGRNAELYYSFKDEQTNFHIDPQSGEITSLKVFDREELANSSYMIVFDVVVKDNGLDRLEDVTTVRVTVQDENDNPPVFRQPVYKVTKFENEARFSNITVVKADDADAGINSIVTYSIIDGNKDGHFVISQTTGQITLDKQLDRETLDFYELTILATDSGDTVRHNATCKVQITVSDINDNFPLFAQSQMDISVLEDVEPGSEVAYFPATDVDIGVNAEITYQLSGKDNDGMFGIDRHTGRVYLLKKPDFETKQSYKLNVTATDKGVPALTYYIRFSITIEDVNDNAPVFQNLPLVFMILENSSGSVTQIQATDSDSGKNAEVQYHIAYQDPPGENFKIVKNSGEIYIDQQIDREVTSFYKLTVVATDQAEDVSKRLKTETVVTINIEDVNDNDPIVTSFNAIAVPVSTPRNEYITTIKVKDKDSGNNGKFSLQLSQMGTNAFSLDSNSGRLLLTNSLPNTPVKYSVTVQANDYGTPSQRTTQAAITIIVTNSDNGPVFDSTSYRGTVVENSVVGKSILRVKATSRQNSPVEYYVTNITHSKTGEEVERHFRVDRTSGVLSTAEVLDREVVGDSFEVEIYAVETSGSSPRTTVTVAHVELQDINDTPPRFSQNYYTVDVDENVQTDFIVTRVAVYDDDSLGGLQLTLNVGSDINLKINQDGTIVTTGPLDREVTPQYTLRVTATDGIQSSSCMVRINLRDVNDNAPKFTKSFYSFDIFEDTLIDTTVGSIRAYDPDAASNGQVAYSLTSGWGNDTFSLDAEKGTFTLLRLLDFEENQLYTVQVNAYDFGNPAKTSSVLVYFNVKDTNDNTPVFEQGIYDVAISENVTVETSVVQVQAPDVDTGLNGEVSYDIIDGDIEGQFRIDSKTGIIYTTALLDRETTPSYSLVVMATDMAETVSERRTATAEVLLTLLDVNDYSPEITSSAIIHVRENTPLNTAVHNFTVRDLDEGPNGQVEFSVVSKSGGKPFTVGKNDGQLRVNTDLDREAVQNYTVTVTVRDLGLPSLSATQNLVIKIADENDHSPVFSPEFYDKEVREDVDIGTTLLQVSATDIDIGLNGIVKFFIISGDDNSDFSLDQSSGVIRVQKSLDYERVTKYNLIIQAEDSGEDMRYSTATVSITVLDVNDNIPMFLDSPYIGLVRENMESLPVHVLNVLAHDEDSPPFNQLSYAIREGDRNLFNMSSTTGEIMVLQKLDREVTSQYTLTVIATDSATGRGLTGSGTVSVFVEDVNDNPPVFDHVGSYIAHVSENADVDTDVTVVKATDADEGSNAQIIYRLTDSIDNKFIIYPNTGRIATRVRLDREEVRQYTLEVIAMDTSLLPLSATATVSVYIDDVNDNPPRFNSQSYTRNLQLPANTGTFVIGVSATDLDSGDNRLVEYSISQPDAAFFRINAKTGVVTTKQSLTSGRSYTLQVTARDKGSPVLSSTVPLTVTVSASSGLTPPTFGSIPTNLKVVENLVLDRVITTVTATSANNAPIVYSIAGGNLGDAFGIERSSGRVKVTGQIDYEVIQQYHLWVKAAESGSAEIASYAEVVIGVEDVNDNVPRFTKPLYNVSILEDEMFNSPVVKVKAYDADSGKNGEVFYSLSGTDSLKFRIDSKTGQIKTYTTLDREQKDTYSLTVTASDSGSQNERKNSTASVRITVLDVNDESPAFTRQFRVKIPENIEVGSFVLRVTSSDKDIGQNAIATYSLTDDAGGIFSIESVSGNITLQMPLDAEQTSSYRLRVSATDGAHAVEGNVEIDVNDVNDNSPVLTQPFSFDFEEMLQPGSLVGVLSATDADISAPNNQVYFSLKLASSYFDLDSDTGIITSLEELTFDPAFESNSLPNRHELVVLVKDLGTPVRSSEQTVYVNIVDYNDHPPVFEHMKYESAVPETTQIGNSIITVHAIDDSDYGDNARVEYFSAGGNGSAFFTVDKFSGIVSVTSDLIGNSNKEYILVVKAEDKGNTPLSSTVNVRLVVTDENRYAPAFVAPATKEITVNENKGIGSLIETFKATDNDRSLNAEVIYEITGGDDDDVFNLDRNNGKLSVKGTLDYEFVKKYTLQITAKDRALIPRQTTMFYTVKLRDLNDNDPIFGQAIDTVFVEENSPLGTPVYHAVAVDIDSGDNAVIRYAIVGEGDPGKKFEMNEITGIVTSRGSLDYETKNVYTITIMALNPDSSRKSTMSLTIYIDGVNEFVPQFVKDAYYFSISESAETKTSVGQVSATDKDSGPDGNVNYFLIGDSNAKGFKIDPRTGVILVSGQPDYESSPSITLEVLAKNWGSVKGNDTDTCTVHISVQDANDPPRFKQDVYHANILENSGADTKVTTVIAEDYDFESSDRVFSYTILAGNSQSLFKINRNTGYISTTGRGILDRETVPVYNITVGAIDTGSPPETGSAIVLIYLDDVNDNGPEFKNFTATVTEGQVVSTLVTTLTQFTTDPDDVRNQGPYTYEKLSGSLVEYEYFDIKSNGEVRTKKVLDRESKPEFMVSVVVKDGGSPTQSSTLSFRVLVTDINDTPPSPRLLTIFVSLYNGRRREGPIADVRPVDPDLDGKPRCTLRSTGTPFSIPSGSCSLLLNENPTLPSYTLEVQAVDSTFDPITYDVSVKVINFDNDTLEHSTIVQVAGIDADEFMSKVYTTFVSSVKSLFDTQDKVLIYSLIDHSGDVLAYLAAKKAGSDEYYLSDSLQQKLLQEKSSIESASNIFMIKVDYSECVGTQCKNGGKCANHMTVSSNSQNADSLNQAFSSPSMDLVSYCSCPAEFTGPDCSQDAKPCGNTFCQNGGVCKNQKCVCPPEWSGTNCGVDVNECLQNVCQNGGSCENLAGSFNCKCAEGFSGETCQNGNNYCKNEPCVRGQCKNEVDKYKCECPYSYWGDVCDKSSTGFSDISYMVFPSVSEMNNEIEVIFATEKERALLLYNPSSIPGSKAFIALEILNGRIRFSVAFGAEDVTRVNIDKKVNTGSWFKVRVNRNRDMSKVWVEECPADGGPCEECQIGAPCYNQVQTANNDRLELGSHPLFIGGVKSLDTILNRTGQVASHDFVGCIRSFFINGQDKLRTSPNEKAGILDHCPRNSSDNVCENYDCENGGTCVPEWAGPVCHCTAKFSGPHCEQALKPFQFGPNSLVKITMKESVRRDAQLEAASNTRRRRATADSSVLVRFSTTAKYGVLLFASTLEGSLCVLSVFDGQLKFTVKQYGASKSVVVTSPGVSDGKWHNATVTITASDVSLRLDGGQPNKSVISTSKFSSVDVKELTLGGVSSPVSSITVDNYSLENFSGCISVFELDGEELPMNGTTGKYSIQPIGGVSNGCTSLCENNACGGKGCTVQGEGVVCESLKDEPALSIGIIIMIVFFVILLIVIVILFIVFRQRRKLCLKAKQQKQNGTHFAPSANSSGQSNADSGYGENNIDKLIIRNHIDQELARSNYQRQNGHFMKPDIINSDIGRSPMPLEMEDGTVIIDNASDLTHLRDLNGEMPEHYDLENASSIAPSDIDVVDHYRHFHDGGKNRRKNKAQSDHSHNSKHSSRHYQSNHGSHHSQGVRDSPNLLTSVPYLNDLARSSPSNTRNSPINQLSRQSPNVRQSPLTHVNMHGHNMPVTDLNGGSRTTSERSLASHRSKQSSSTPNKPKRQMLPNGNPPNSKKPLNHNYENSKFLTLEEVDRLNARTRESPASLMEAFSTSSENNTRKMQKPFERYQDTNMLLEPPESSSDDSANDSFTCSEFEYESEKPRNDFDPNSRIFSNLTEVENENEDGAYLNKNFKTDGLDSGGNSFSSNERSSDDNQGQSKIPNNAFNWDDLLNWGPKFEKLVGVFTDIALLPDADSVDFVDVEGKSTEREEYV